jgi:hypothetical protein
MVHTTPSTISIPYLGILNIYARNEFFTDGFENSEAVVMAGVNAGSRRKSIEPVCVDYEACLGFRYGTSDSRLVLANRVSQLVSEYHQRLSEGVESFIGVSQIDKPMTIRNAA